MDQAAIVEKSSEISAISGLFSTLGIEGCMVMLDSMGTETKISCTLRARGAHYVLCVKGNHPKLRESIRFADIRPRGPLTPNATNETTINEQRRIEIRRCRAHSAIDRLYNSDDC